jgi:diguanylate cyclase (GGDEF)-like protein
MMSAVSPNTPSTGQVACSMSSVLLRRLRQSSGEQMVQAVLERAGVDYTPSFLDDPGNWIWYSEAVALFEAAVALTGDERLPQRVGEDAVRQHAGSPVATLLRGLGSPEAVYEQLTVGVTKFSTVTEMHPVEVSPGRAVVRARAREGFGHHQHMCAWRIGLLSTPTVLFGLAPARVAHPECALRGDEHCVYEMSWDAAAAEAAGDPQQIITALETQLAAMTDRLDSMYATARDLIALDDVDGALQRITERAATAVRVPTYLLAVHTGEEQLLRVHHHGLPEHADPAEEARALLSGDPEADDSRLVAEVASTTRRYGRIMAASPAGAFFPHERDLLGVYARYAAAVLDTYTALDAVRRREEQSRALLELAQAVAAATTTDDVARRLADAVPAVVDSDRVLVFLWEEDEGALVWNAATDRGAEVDETITSLRICPSDTPVLAKLLSDPRPEPLFFASDCADRYIAGIMERTGSRALIVVPIVAHERFYGVLNVSVVEREERLEPTPALLDRLAGVVAQAATAFDGARMIELMSDQARRDNLTGLLGHRAFHERLREALQTGGTFALASVDIDDFKQINDRHGHPVGDEALRRVADALRGAVRDGDTVFRVGGEEFAVLIHGLDARDAVPVAERLRSVVSKADFHLPLRVSVGLASWPGDATDGATLLERADAALYAAKRDGKDRVRLVADAGVARIREDGLGRARALEVVRALGLEDARVDEVAAVLAQVLAPSVRAA